jgi:hypothetical protein
MGVENRVERGKMHRNTSCAREIPRADWKRDLQICGEGRESRRRPTLVVGKKPNGKYQLRGAGKKPVSIMESLKIATLEKQRVYKRESDKELKP